MLSETQLLARMDALTQAWEARADRRATFLRCYRMMTANMLAAIARREFADPAWVEQLLHRFADYYFVALEAHEQAPATAPVVWQLAFAATRQPQTTALQLLLLGVNAHINYDLVLTLEDLLQPDWAGLSPDQREARYADHSQVNAIIGQTIDAVQDQILEPAMPGLDWLDQVLGPVDELVISRVITHWREGVWRHAGRLLEAASPGQRAELVSAVEHDAVRLGEFILLRPAGGLRQDSLTTGGR